MPRSRSAKPRPAPLPAGFEPQLATLVKAPPPGDDWLHELKYDGYRIGCRVDGDRIQLLSRRGKDWTAQFPEICAAARKLPVKTALIDGEAAVLMPDGRTSFQALQNFFGAGSRAGLVFFAFDLLHLDGQDLSELPLEERKRALEEVVVGRKKTPGLIRYSEHVVGGGADFFKHACRLGLEGIVSKQADGPYKKGRTTGWLKSKCIKRQELVIGGFTDPEGSREGIGALLVGVYQGGKLAFAGKVGTGFTVKAARDLRKKLNALERPTPPFDPRPTGPDARAHWVEPTLVAEVSFAEMTGDGKVRHASFQGLRVPEDKPAREVVKESPLEETPDTVAKKSAGPKGKKASKEEPEVAGVRISHADRVVYPDAGITKLELARYYESIAEHVLPHVTGRPLSLVRCPEGLAGKGKGPPCFYMKHSDLWAPEALRKVKIRERTKVGQYLVIDDLAGVVSLVQMGVLEIHTWNSTADDVEHPNRVVFDLDPGPDVEWTATVEAARMVRDVLGSLELESFLKTTGGKGLHIVVPFAPGPSWDESLEFTRVLSTAIAGQNPARYTVNIPKAGREKKILIDFLRNTRGATSVAAFSTRAKPTAPVSVPLGWEELSPRLTSDHFTVATLPDRLRRRRSDPWKSQGYDNTRQKLTPAILRAVAQMVK
jgi:bifunctional non-homologous end joining protein LigD